jgi:hypothetical protein
MDRFEEGERTMITQSARRQIEIASKKSGEVILKPLLVGL